MQFASPTQDLGAALPDWITKFDKGDQVVGPRRGGDAVAGHQGDPPPRANQTGAGRDDASWRPSNIDAFSVEISDLTLTLPTSADPAQSRDP
ncbi:MAG: hypothetical protein H0T70_00835 [Acidimicrobiia bacterium]|nr:hypothetical protein [Acidimicrobiia bacterium]